MKVLNLVYPEKSDIKYKISKFPDGQQQFTSMSIPLGITEAVTIKSRLNNFNDLELIICSTKALRELGIKEIHLYTPYFLGSRSDRKFEEGSNNYLKDVICPIINSLNFDSVTVMDPHSDVLEACLNNFKKQSIGDFYDWCYKEINSSSLIIVSPDIGALKKIYSAQKQMRNTNEILICSKLRDTQGNLTKVEVPLRSSYLFDYVIIDDICDGGRTFINIADVINPLIGENKLYLVVTHGIFSAGLSTLKKSFDGIFCTNSYSDITSINKFNVFL